MAVFPKIQSPCPYRGDLAAVMDGDFCRACSRQVFDLTAWDDGERRAFLAGCAEEVCVSYRLPLRPAIAAAALAVAAIASPAAAQTEDEEVLEMIIVGGIKDPAAVQYVELPSDAALPDLPVVYEEPDAPANDEPAEAAVKAAGVTPPPAS